MAGLQLQMNGLSTANNLLGIAIRNMQAVAVAQQQMLESLLSLNKAQVNIAEAAIRKACGNGVSVSDVAGQIDSLKTSLLESQANMNVLSELVTRGMGEVGSTLQTRALKALDELKDTLGAVQPERPALPAVTGPAARPVIEASAPASP
jgi:hypothetical protein